MGVGLVKWLFLCMEWVSARRSVIGYTNHVISPEVFAQKFKIQSDKSHQTFREAGTLKRSHKDNPTIPDIFFSAPVSLFNSTLYIGRIVYCY